MALRITCPSCKAIFVIDSALRGKRILCPDCKKQLAVPAIKAGPVPPISEKANPEGIIAAKPKSTPAKTIPQTEMQWPDKSGAKGPARPQVKKKSALPLFLLIGGGLLLFGVAFVAAAVIAFPLVFQAHSPAPKKVAASAPPPQPVVPEAPPESSKSEEDPKPPESKTKPEKPKAKQSLPALGPKATSEPGGVQLNKDVLAKVKRATVYVRVTLPSGTISQGSGFFGIEPGLVLTNAHVVGMLSAASENPKKIEIVCQNGEPDSRTFTGQILGVDRSSDLAVLRVEGQDLPPPLEVKSASELAETQIVYVVGYPFGSALGKNITVGQSTVSSLRKDVHGEVSQVQVNGGMHPGNSGGPVVNANGDVIGVAVSIIQGTQINFAVPGEQAHMVLNGCVTGVENGPMVRSGDKIRVPISIAVVDPLSRMQSLKCEWWTAKAGKARPRSATQPSPEPGDSPRLPIDLNIAAGRAKTEIHLPSTVEADHVIWVQVVTVDVAGKTSWWPTVTINPPPRLEPQSVHLGIKHLVGARPLFFSSMSQLGIVTAAGENFKTTAAMTSSMTETMVSQEKETAKLRWHYLTPNSLNTTSKVKAVWPLLSVLHADLVVDDRNHVKTDAPDLAKVPTPRHQEHTDFHANVRLFLELLCPELPGREVAAGETWLDKRKLMFFNGEERKTLPIEVKYVYQGVNQNSGRPQAVIDIHSSITGNLDGKRTITGTLTGAANLDLHSYQFATAEILAELTIQEPDDKITPVRQKFKMERFLGKEILNVKGQIKNDDALDPKDRPHKVHLVKVEADKPVVFSLESLAGKSRFDTYLRVEHESGKPVAVDDNGGVDQNSMIMIKPSEPNTYRVLVSGAQRAVGEYHLIVRQ